MPANEKEYEPLADLVTSTPAEVVIADTGLSGSGDQARLAAYEVRLLTPDRTRRAANIGAERAPAWLVIESVFANLKGQIRLERHLAKNTGCPSGSRNGSSLTIGMLLILAGRPARALAAYDGR